MIDELDLVLNQLFRGIPIHEVTLTDRGNVERLEKDRLDCEGCVFMKHFTFSDVLTRCNQCKRCYKPKTLMYHYYADLYEKEV